MCPQNNEFLCGLIQEIQNYADLEHKYTSIMDKNDFSTPISKEDPIYVMFLKFLQQVIDDMKVLFLPISIFPSKKYYSYHYIQFM